MSYNGSGTFVINTAGQPVVSGTVISSTAFNALTADLATGLSTAITKDGQTTPTANIPMGNNKITGLAAGTAATDAANLSQVQSTTAKLINSVSGADTITGTLSPTLTAYAAGQMFYFVAAGDNTGAVTLNINSLGAKSVTRDGTTALIAGDIKSGEMCVVVYDGTQFQLVNAANSFGNLNVTGNLTLSAGTANGVLYLNGSKVAASGSALTFDGLNALSLGSGGTANTATALTLNATDNAANGSYILGKRNGTNAWLIGDTSSGLGSGTGFISYNYGTAPWIWYLQTGGEQMRLTSTGLGIGTTSPVFKLVVSNAGAQGFEFDPSVGLMQIYNRSTSAYGEFRPYASLMRFFTGSSPTETMRLDSSGSLGLGVTPVSASSIVKAFEFGQRGVLWATTSSTNIALSANGYLNASSAWTYKETGTATAYQQDGSHKWLIAGSGTGGTAITFTQAMTLDASGNLGVGTTSPGERLDVRNGGLSVGNGTIKTVVSYTTEGLVGTTSNHALLLYANNAERARITAAGGFAVGTTTDPGAGNIGLAAGKYFGYSSTAYMTPEDNVSGARISSPGVVSFWTGATPAERARITSGGDLLVGNTASVQSSRAEFTSTSLTPAFLARVNVDADEGQWAGQFQKKTNTNTTSQIFVRFLINDGATASGYITANGANAATFTSSSDERLKENIADLPPQLASIQALRPVEFDYKDGSGHQIGFIAQELQTVYPDCVSEGADGMLQIGGWSKTEARLVKAIQEQQAMIKALEAKVAALESK